MRRVGVRLVAVAAAVLVALAWVTLTHHRGADSGRTALAIARVEPTGFGNGFHLITECADHVEVEVSRDAGGSDLPQVTVWGRPRVGRCDSGAVVSFPLSAFRQRAGGPAPLTHIVDGASSQVVPLNR